MFSLRNFPQKRENEKVLIFLRRHWFVLLKSSLVYLLLLVLPVVFYFVFKNSLDLIYNNYNYLMLVILFLSIYYLFIWLFIYNSFIDYYLDVWIVTDKRVISIEQENLFARTISVKELHRLQDATSEVKGFLPTFFDYGNVFVQTAGEKERFIFKSVPNPSRVAQKIVGLVQKQKEKEENDL